MNRDPELFERLMVRGGRGGEHAGQPSPRRVGVLVVGWDLDLRQEVGAEELDKVAGQFLHV